MIKINKMKGKKQHIDVLALVINSLIFGCILGVFAIQMNWIIPRHKKIEDREQIRVEAYSSGFKAGVDYVLYNDSICVFISKDNL